MEVYIANLLEISNISTYVGKLSADEQKHSADFLNLTRKKQYIVGHAIVQDICKEKGENQVKNKDFFISIAHKDNWVLVAVSNTNVGVDIENINIERDIKGICELLNLPKCLDLEDFYKQFVQYESKLKMGKVSKNIHSFLYKKDNYILCICSENSLSTNNIKFKQYNSNIDLSSIIFVGTK